MSVEMSTPYRHSDRAETYPRLHVASRRGVREDGEYYIPDLIASDPCGSRPEVYSAANEHAGDLRDAEQQLDDVLNLARVLRCAVQGETDSRAMQADTVLKIIDDKLCSAHRLIDRHDARHLNLFMAYFDLKQRAGGTGDD